MEHLSKTYFVLPDSYDRVWSDYAANQLVGRPLTVFRAGKWYGFVQGILTLLALEIILRILVHI